MSDSTLNLNQTNYVQLGYAHCVGLDFTWFWITLTCFSTCSF